MGGYGSGRQSNRATVEGTVVLNINSLIRQRLFARYGAGNGVLKWTRSSDGQEVASAGFSLDTTSIPIRMELYYTYKAAKQVSTNLLLDAVPSYFGGKILYFVCPKCGLRAWSVYLLGAVKCRQCHNLTYQSCKESHSSDSLCAAMAAKMNRTKEDVRRALNSMIRNSNKERERKKRLSRRGRKRKALES